jgi:hypothetical protein
MTQGWNGGCGPGDGSMGSGFYGDGSVANGLYGGNDMSGQSADLTSALYEEHSGWRCEHPSCARGGSFGRPYDLQRHDKTIHKSPGSFHCIVEGCVRVGEPFNRLDNLTQHIKTKHHHDQLFSCRAKGCEARLPLDLLMFHYHRHSLCEQEADKQSHAVMERLATLGFKCPLKKCNTWNTNTQDFKDHLSSHLYEVKAQGQAALRAEGFTREGNAWCPFCSSKMPPGEFKNHLAISHYIYFEDSEDAKVSALLLVGDRIGSLMPIDM